MTIPFNDQRFVPRIKMCGFTRHEDIDAAIEVGADALGFVFYPPSPRNVSFDQAKSLFARIPPFVTAVALVVDPDPAWLHLLLQTLPVGMIQFHGNEPPAFCTAFNRPYLKAIRVKPGMDLVQYAADYAGASGLLLDAYVEGVPGGTGHMFDWRLIPQQLPVPVVLAGGLTPENVHDAILRTKPWAVDVSGGIEAAKGIKDSVKMRAFVQAVRQ